MTFRTNVVANYASQLYVTLIGIIMVPVYLRYLGAEAYGLVGFFTMMQAWFQLLDLGLSPTLARETARYKGGAVTPLELRNLFRALECFFWATAGVAAVVVVLCSDWIAGHWLQVQELPVERVKMAVVLMGLTVPLRWTAGLYRGTVNGFERQTLLASLNALIATGRFVGVVPVLAMIGAEPIVFFTYQLVIAGIEVTLLMALAHRLMPVPSADKTVALSVRPLMHVLRFSGVVAVTGLIWVLITQLDKLLLSKFLPLSEYGYYTLAVAVANGINVLGIPIAQPLMPRLARLYTERREQDALRLYRTSTIAVSTLVAPAVLLLVLFSEEVIFAWTGDSEAARHAAPILRWYAAGNGALALAAFGYYIQYGQGKLRMHFLGNVVLACALIPSLFVACIRYGAVGAAAAWAISMHLYFWLWIPLTHRVAAPGLHGRWVSREVLPPFLGASLIAYAMTRWEFVGGVSGVMTIIITGFAMLLGAAAAALLSSKLTSRRRTVSNKATAVGS